MRKERIFGTGVRNYETRLIKLLVKMGASKGQNERFSAIIGYLLLHDSLTQKELKELTGFSLATVSINLNILMGMGSITKRLVKGTHEFEYSLGDDISAVASSTSMLKKETNDENVAFFSEKIEELKQFGKENVKDVDAHGFLSRRMEEMLEFFTLQREILEEISKPEFMATIIGGMKKNEQDKAPRRAIGGDRARNR